MVVGELVDATLKKYSSTRFGLLSYDEDGTIKQFFSYGLENCAQWDSDPMPVFPQGKFPMGLASLRSQWAGYPHVATYVVAGGGHTFLGSDIVFHKTGSMTMLEWIKKLIHKSEGWGNVVP